MATLSSNQADVLDAVRLLSKNNLAQGVATHSIRSLCWSRHRLTYDQVDRALRGLLDLGLLSKPKRGSWCLVEDKRA